MYQREHHHLAVMYIEIIVISSCISVLFHLHLET